MKNLAKKIQDFMVDHDLTLSVAESCTSGKIASILASNDGASQFFNGGIVCYQNFVKQRLLAVDRKTIEKYDVVSKQVAHEMAKGVVACLDSDCGISVTGYASTSNNPSISNGTIFIGYYVNGYVTVNELHLNGSREENINVIVKTALKNFYDLLIYSKYSI